MAKPLSASAAPQTTAEYEAEFELLMQEAARLNELMAQDRIEIERLKLETSTLAEETGRIKADTRALLASMGARL